MLLASMPRAVGGRLWLASLLCLAALCSACNRHSDASIDSHYQCVVEQVQIESETWKVGKQPLLCWQLSFWSWHSQYWCSSNLSNWKLPLLREAFHTNRIEAG